jgi:hypothetical protein
MVEVDRLTRLSPNEWKLWYRKSAQTLGVAPETLCDIIEAKLKDIKAAERAAETEKRRQEARAEKSRERAQRDIDKAAARKSKDKAKAFADIAKLQSDCTEPELTRVSERLGEDLTALRDEFSEYAESSVDETAAMPSTVWRVEPWPEPVVTATLLRDLIAKIDQHFAARHPHEVLAIALWVTMAWVHEVAATHSAFLMATSAEPDSGKTTLLGTVSYLTPKPFNAVEMTGPTLYRVVDREKPTLILDEADDLFKRKTDIKHIINSSWTRGTKIPRQVSINGNYVTKWFDPFCPKAIGFLEGNVPRNLLSRGIIIKTWPKKPEDKQGFNHVDDDTFIELRRKLARWSTDNATAMKEAKPLYPAGFNNRRQANWRLLLAIAELAGGKWPKQAQEAAARVSKTVRKQSWGVQMLHAFQQIFAGGR